MKTFNEYRNEALNEGAGIKNAEDFAEKTKKEMQKMFPDSYIKVAFDSKIVPSIEVVFADNENMDPKRPGSDIIENAPHFTRFMVGNAEIKGTNQTQIAKDGTFNSDKLTIKRSQGPRDIKFRQRTSTPEKVKAAITDYLGKIKENIKKEEG